MAQVGDKLRGVAGAGLRSSPGSCTASFLAGAGGAPHPHASTTTPRAATATGSQANSQSQAAAAGMKKTPSTWGRPRLRLFSQCVGVRRSD
jgi:hypothetical protein